MKHIYHKQKLRQVVVMIAGAAAFAFCAQAKPKTKKSKSADKTSAKENVSMEGTSAMTLDKASFDKANIFGQGEPNTAYAAYFVGQSYLKPVTLGGRSPRVKRNIRARLP